MSKKLRLSAVVLAAAILGALVCTIGIAWHAGDRLYVVKTGSMSPTYDPGDAVLDRPASAGYSIGQPVTVQISAAGDLVSHRLVRIDKHGLLHTKGDANRTPDAWAIPPEHVRGVVRTVLPKLGYAMVFLRQPQGVFGVMTSAITLFLLWGLCFPASSSAVGADDDGAEAGAGVRVPRQRSAGDPAGVLAGRGKVRTWSVRRSRDTADEDAPTRAQPK